MSSAFRTIPHMMMMMMMVHVIMVAAARIVGRWCVGTVLGLLDPPFFLLRTSEHLLLLLRLLRLLLLLLLLHRLLRRFSLSVISVRTSCQRRLASRSVTVAGCRTDLDVLRIRRLRSVLHFDVVRSSEKVQTKGFLLPAAFLFAPHTNVRW